MKDSRGKDKLAVVVDLEDAFNRVKFKMILELLVQYAHKMTRSSTPGEIAIRLGNWISTPKQLTSTRLCPVPCPLLCPHEGTGGSEQ